MVILSPSARWTFFPYRLAEHLLDGGIVPAEVCGSVSEDGSLWAVGAALGWAGAPAVTSVVSHHAKTT
jgi:hypothetical protein